MGKLHEILYHRRKELGLTLADVAASVGVSKGTVSRWESGQIDNMRRDRLAALAKTLKMSPLALMGMEENAAEEPESPENIQPVRSQKKIPLLGRIAAGMPIYAEQNIEGYEYLQSQVRADFCLEVRGDSMINAGIHTGDIVFIRQQPEVQEGEIAAVLIDGEATLKRFYRHGSAVELRPENSRYKSMFFTEENGTDFRVLGKAVALQTLL